jgi:hypothetical protein
VATLLTLASFAACTRTVVERSASVPPVVPKPPSPVVHAGGAGQATVAWIGGTLTDVQADRLVLREAAGSMVTLHRLAEGATAFFRVAAGAWHQVAASADVEPSQLACIEAAMAGTNLLALRVFLGADCGPA